MITIENREQCCGCGACAQICPKKCITMTEDAEGFLYPNLNLNSCIQCGLCEDVCPVQNIKSEPTDDKPEAYVAYHSDDSIREKSSSGGVFTALAESVLEKGGAVFGAAMSSDCRCVYHRMAETKIALAALRGSKYLQSNIGDTYIRIKQLLDQGREVLFCGTPCQVEGLQTFLAKRYNNLTSIDFICHGVPSSKVWKHYVDYREKCAGEPIRDALFRYKKNGWKSYSLFLEFSKSKYEKTHDKDLFLQIFLRDICLRPSCYVCSFKKLNRSSDITLADCWGCNKLCPELDDDRGLSLVLIHSNAGKHVFKKIQHTLAVRRVDVMEALKGNPAMTNSCRKPIQRDSFMSCPEAMSNPLQWRKWFPRRSWREHLRSIIPARIKKLILRH